MARQRLRLLQLELHPDKQPEERRLVVQPLFLLVQQAWELQQEVQEVVSPRQAWCDWAQRARAFNEKETPKAKAKPKAREAPRAEPKPKAPREAKVPDLGTSESSEGERALPGRHWSPQDEEDEDGIVAFLSSGSLEDVMQAFTSIQVARRSRGLDAERPGHPWKAKMDRLEAEAWRLLAKQQRSSGFHRFAMAEHLQKAISLDPGRGELYLDRALSRLADNVSLEALAELDQGELSKALEDVNLALSKDVLGPLVFRAKSISHHTDLPTYYLSIQSIHLFFFFLSLSPSVYCILPSFLPSFLPASPHSHISC